MAGTRLAGLLLTLAAVALALGVATWRDGSPASARAAEEAVSALGTHMATLDDGMKKLRRSLRKDDAWQESIEMVIGMQHAAFEAKALLPPMLEKVAAGDRDQFLAGYRKEMAVLCMELLNLEISLLDRNAEAAQASYDKLREIKETGHKNFSEVE